LFDNLMIEAAIAESGGALLLDASEPAQRWTDLAAFERCVALAAKELRGSEPET
jgi:hypothetical protein